MKAAEDIKQDTGKEIFHFVTDVSDAQSLNSFFKEVKKRFGKIDILVTNAGGPPLGSSNDFTDEDYQSAFELTLMSVIRSCSLVLPEMQENGWGRIINLTSTSVKSALENLLLSNVFRSAVAGFTKSIALESARSGIRVHCVMPGPFLTDRMTEIGESISERDNISFEKWKEEAEANTLMGKFGDPLDIGNLVAFLASDRSNYMTGTCIAIDGGALKSIS